MHRSDECFRADSAFRRQAAQERVGSTSSRRGRTVRCAHSSFRADEDHAVAELHAEARRRAPHFACPFPASFDLTRAEEQKRHLAWFSYVNYKIGLRTKRISAIEAGTKNREE